MLMAIAVIAIAGGILAFKAGIISSDLCTAPVEAPGQCQFASSSSVAEFKVINPDFYYVTLEHDDNFDITSCTTRQDCNTPGVAVEYD